ncbi:sugar transporter 12 [Danaus plexippus plexippus]|uniref:Sugar transporter 12 n=1 Tax=Danaus plexippus plexippus TaxID=278856 RepID=A0A212EZG0_DANPL|nr:sugar transporter 12 [Danaus plexippus plexippus]
MGFTTQKVLMLGSLSSIAVSNGFLFAQTTGMLKSLQRNEDGLNLTESNILWLTSTISMIFFLGSFLTTLSDNMGRRWPLMISSVAIVVQWIILYKAQNIYHFMLSRIIAGIAFGARFCLNILVTPEYTSPKTRVFFLNIITSVSPAIGTGLGHYLGNIFHWRTVALISIFPTLFGVIVPYFCVESPHWLASRGRFQECEESFRKIHGNSLKSESELQHLIKMEKCKLRQAEITNTRTSKAKLCLALKKKYFWNLILLSFFMSSYIAATGRVAFAILATNILEDMTGTPNIVLYNVLVDIFILVGTSLSCVLVRKMTIRNVLFSTGFMGNAVLVILSACLHFGAGVENLRWVNVSLLAVYFILMEAGPSPVLEALLGEIFPLEIKVYCMFLVGVMISAFVSSALIVFSILAKAIGYSGTFLLNAVIMSTSLVFIKFKLPETKGRTLQEIEAFFKTNIFDIDEALNDEKKNMLL